jgi:hypothetical protein
LAWALGSATITVSRHPQIGVRIQVFRTNSTLILILEEGNGIHYMLDDAADNDVAIPQQVIKLRNRPTPEII